MREGEYSREVVISNIARRKLLQNYFVLFSLELQGIKEKVKYMNITIEKTVTKPVHSNNQIKARLLFKVSTFNLTGRE